MVRPPEKQKIGVPYKIKKEKDGVLRSKKLKK